MRQDFSTIYEDFIGSIYQPGEMAYYIRALREQNAKFNFLPASQKNFTLRILQTR
jgi:hypothetical protein